MPNPSLHGGRQVKLGRRATVGFPAAYDPARWGAALIYGQSWQSYADTAALQAANKFFTLNSLPTDGDNLVDLASDATFVQCARICQPYEDENTSATGGASPRHESSVFSPLVALAWWRSTIKYTPGYTPAGTYPVGAAQSWKQQFLYYDAGYGSRMEIEMDTPNSFFLAYVPTGPVTWNAPTILTPPAEALGDLNDDYNPTTARNDGEWYEAIQCYEWLNAGALARWRWWWRKLTTNGVIENASWYFTGRERTTASGIAPKTRAIGLGVNKNMTARDDGLSTTSWDSEDNFKTGASPQTLRGSGWPFRGEHVSWGPTEVVDGAIEADPYGVASWGT